MQKARINLASPEIAVEILREAEKQLKKDFDVTRAPFGYYKEFELKCKGHPLSELSREINVSEKIREAKNCLRENSSITRSTIKERFKSLLTSVFLK